MNEKRILQDTLDWYLEKLSPNTRIAGIKDLLSGIQSEINSNHISEAVELLVGLYENLPAQLKAQTPYPGPTPEFRQLVINEEEGFMSGGGCGCGSGGYEQLGGDILKDVLNVNNKDYRVLGLLLQSQDGNYYLYDLDTRSIVSEYMHLPVHGPASIYSPAPKSLTKSPAPKTTNNSPRFHTPDTSPESSPRVEIALKQKPKRIFNLPPPPTSVKRGSNIYDSVSAALVQ